MRSATILITPYNHPRRQTYPYKNALHLMVCCFQFPFTSFGLPRCNIAPHENNKTWYKTKGLKFRRPSKYLTTVEVKLCGCDESLRLDSCHNYVGPEIITQFPKSCCTSFSVCLSYLFTPQLYGPPTALASLITAPILPYQMPFFFHLLTFISRISFCASSRNLNLDLLILILQLFSSGLLSNTFWIPFTHIYSTSLSYVSIMPS